MTGTRSPHRDKAKKQWLDSSGTVTTKELADTYGVSVQSIRNWRREDNWQQELTDKQPKKRSGQKGNKNAVGYGAPIGSKNAEIHGAYSRINLDSLTPEEREYIESLTIGVEDIMLREYRLLIAKERDLVRKMQEYEEVKQDTLYIDRVIEVSGEKANTQTVIKASRFDRLMKLEAEYNKIHGRIIKLIDSIRSRDIDIKRINLDERKHTLAKQKLSGEYNIDPETGEVEDIESLEDLEV